MAGTNKKEATFDTDNVRARLNEERDRLMRDADIKAHQVAEDGDDLDPERGGVGNHLADDANQTAEQETMLTIESNIQRQIDQVNEAIARLDEGTYGICANCGKPISAARLEARPSSIYCIDCQQLQDAGRI